MLPGILTGSGKTAAALNLAAEAGFDVLECGMEGSFSWEQRLVGIRAASSSLLNVNISQCLDDSNNSPIAPLVKFLADVRRGARRDFPSLALLQLLTAVVDQPPDV
jgi:hypothetical protein